MLRFYVELLHRSPEDPLLWCQLAAAHMQAGAFAKAEPLVAQAAMLLGNNPHPSPAAAACKHLQALVQLNRGKDFYQAEVAAANSSEIWKNMPGEGHACMAASINNLAVLYLLHGDYSGAKGLFEGACDIWSKSPATRDLHLAAVMDNMAVLYQIIGQDRQAEQSLAQAATIVRGALPRIIPCWP